jgi:hypothetical protein
MKIKYPASRRALNIPLMSRCDTKVYEWTLVCKQMNTLMYSYSYSSNIQRCEGG